MCTGRSGCSTHSGKMLLMFNSYSVTLPVPGKPAFFFGGGRSELTMTAMDMKFDQSTSKSLLASMDEASISEVYPR